MNKKDIEKFKIKLLAEKAQLEEEIGGIASKNPNSPGIWDASAATMEVDHADDNEVADKLEELDENTAIVAQLENQLIEVNDALDRITNGKYGFCEKCGKPIDMARLEANPSSRYSIDHSDLKK